MYCVHAISNPFPLHYLCLNPSTGSTFVWGAVDITSFTKLLDTAYKEAVHWRKTYSNFYKVKWASHSPMTIELTHLFNAFSTSSALESVALREATVMSLLILLKPHCTSRTKEHINHLENQLEKWKEGDLNSLLREGRAI